MRLSADGYRFTCGGQDYFYLAESGALFLVEPGTEAADLRAAMATLPGVPPTGSVASAEAPVTNLIAVIAQACNLACSYCYAGAGRLGRSGKMMSPETGRQAVAQLFELAGDASYLNITFFGGEPLLNLPTLQTMVAAARERARTIGKEVGFSVTTNGTRFSEAAVGYLDTEGVSITVSMDGPALIHDQFRRSPSGNGSYDAIVAGMAVLFRHYRARPVTCRVTVTSHAPAIDELFWHLYSLGFAEVGFSPVSSLDPSLRLGRVDLQEYVAAFARLGEAFLERARRGELLGVGNLLSLLRMIHRGERKTHPCGAGFGLMAVDPDGCFGFCHRFVGAPGFSLGDLQRGLDRRRRVELQIRGEVGQKQACTSCWARRLCAGGCHYDVHLHRGRMEHPVVGLCDYYRGMIGVGLEVYARLAAEVPQILTRAVGEAGPNCTQGI